VRYNAGAALRLAKLYYEGLGVEQDLVTSLKFACLTSFDVRQPHFKSSVSEQLVETIGAIRHHFLVITKASNINPS
jgi:hypothetical protein